jgi:hypothetical protein
MKALAVLIVFALFAVIVIDAMFSEWSPNDDQDT